MCSNRSSSVSPSPCSERSKHVAGERTDGPLVLRPTSGQGHRPARRALPHGLRRRRLSRCCCATSCTTRSHIDLHSWGRRGDPVGPRGHRLHPHPRRPLSRRRGHRTGVDTGGHDRCRPLALEPDPKSRMGASRFIGHSPSAERVIVVIAYRDLDGDLHGVNAWPATGADLRLYQQGDDDGQDD